MKMSDVLDYVHNLIHQATWFNVICLVIITILLVLLLVNKRMNAPPSLKGAYLNYSSTNARKNGTLNPSDLAYPQVLEDRYSFNQLRTPSLG